MSRYAEYVAGMRAEFYAMVPRALWEEMAGRVDEMVAAAEDVVGEAISENIPVGDASFLKFWMFSTRGSVNEEYADLGRLTDGVVKRIAWRRWWRLSERERRMLDNPW